MIRLHAQSVRAVAVAALTTHGLDRLDARVLRVGNDLSGDSDD